MIKNFFLFVVSMVVLTILSANIAFSISYTVINPSDDGCIWSNKNIDRSYLLAGSDIHGIVEFSTNTIIRPFSRAVISVNPYAMPLWGYVLNVYGYSSYDGKLTWDDYNAGTFLGRWVLPASLTYGQDTYFDVTQFIENVSSPYVGFNLQSSSIDDFSSLKSNYGHPAQLSITNIPEPSSILTLLYGLFSLARKRRKQESV